MVDLATICDSQSRKLGRVLSKPIACGHIGFGIFAINFSRQRLGGMYSGWTWLILHSWLHFCPKHFTRPLYFSIHIVASDLFTASLPLLNALRFTIHVQDYQSNEAHVSSLRMSISFMRNVLMY